MCLIKWNEQSFKWFTTASQYTGYNRKLAALLLERIGSRGTLCDLGCGMGLIDFELAPHFEKITCVDISEPAIHAVRRGAEARGIRNIEAFCGDAAALDGQWDAVISLFHGQVEDYPKYLSMTRDCFVPVMHGSSSNASLERYRDRSAFVPSTREYLDARGVKYTSEELTLEYGQPFESLADAAEFVSAYSKNAPDESADDYLRKNLVETGEEKYPFYLPKTRSFGIFVLKKSENPDFSY